MDLNKVNLIGRVENIIFNELSNVTIIDLVTKIKYYDKGDKIRINRHRVMSYGNVAIALQKMEIGDKLCIDGRLEQKSIQGKESVVVVVDRFQYKRHESI